MQLTVKYKLFLSLPVSLAETAPYSFLPSLFHPRHLGHFGLVSPRRLRARCANETK
jgi:hypothetical protein